MHLSVYAILTVAAQASGVVLPRDDSGPPDPGDPTVSDPGLQAVPDTGKPDNTFNNGQPQRVAGPPYGSDVAPDLYQPRDIDLPFGWMFHGNMSIG